MVKSAALTAITSTSPGHALTTDSKRITGRYARRPGTGFAILRYTRILTNATSEHMRSTRRSEFVDLDRRFRKLNPNETPEAAGVRSYTRALGGEGAPGWDDILKSRIVVVLGEPGSGKSWELEDRARRLAENGGFAFLIPLERLARQSLEAILSPEDQQHFRQWSRSGKSATFFLDSVDEAKLRASADFSAALCTLRSAIGDGFARARLVLSSRITEWQPAADRSELQKLFTLPSEKTVDASSHQVSEKDTDASIAVVELEPLDRDRVTRLASAQEGFAVQAFVAALDEAHAWEFARRPIDVVDLMEFWTARGRLGSLSELLEFDVDRKLRETTRRERKDPLSQEKARQGAETLGAATVLCRQPTFRVPDDVLLHSQDAGALDAAACLPADWRPEERRALLERAIFDSASYGRIRFHHRRVGEYLAAKWLQSRVNEGCSVEEIEELLSDTVGTKRVIRPALGPVAAWLASEDDALGHAVREWVLNAAPEVHLKYGDPARLPLQYRRDLLRRLVQQFDGRQRVWIDLDDDCLGRLANPELADDVTAIIRNRSISADLRAKMLLLVRHGRLTECLDAALDVVSSPDEGPRIKAYAAATLRDVHDEQSLQRLAGIATSLTKVPNDLGAILSEALYPGTVEASALGALLRKTGPVPEFGVDLPYFLQAHIERALIPEQCGALLSELLALLEQPPLRRFPGTTLQVSAQFSWVGKVIPTVLLKLFSKTVIGSREADSAATALRFLSILRHDHHFRELPSDLNERTLRHGTARQRTFWLLVDDWRAENPNQSLTFIGEVFDYHEILKANQTDLEWLIADIHERKSPADRALAARLATQLWNWSGRRRDTRARIRGAVRNDQTLRSVFRAEARRGRFPKARSFWYRHIRGQLGQRWWCSVEFGMLDDGCKLSASSSSFFETSVG
jgi:hypothetical protein